MVWRSEELPRRPLLELVPVPIVSCRPPPWSRTSSMACVPRDRHPHGLINFKDTKP
jgi:hypothetical protein